jgi:hypothetical protein
MNQRSLSLACVSTVATVALLLARPVSAADPSDSARASQASQAEEDPRVLQLAEPDYRVINMATTMLLPSRAMSFDLTHRFGGNLIQDGFVESAKSLFGIDDGATVGLELRYGLARHLQVVAYRTSFDRTIQLSGKYDAIRQAGASPVSVSGLLSVEAAENFSERYAPAFGAVVSRTIADSVALYASPVFVHNSAALTGETRNTFFVSLGGRVRILQTVYLAAEISPRVSGYAPGQQEYSFAIEKRAGGHMFQLNFTNTFATTHAQLARGGFRDSLYMGFNLARKFF